MFLKRSNKELFYPFITETFLKLFPPTHKTYGFMFSQSGSTQKKSLNINFSFYSLEPRLGDQRMSAAFFHTSNGM